MSIGSPSRIYCVRIPDKVPYPSRTTAGVKTLAVLLHTWRQSVTADVSFHVPFWASHLSCEFSDRIPIPVWEIGPLPQGDLYSGPDAGQDNLCQCNTVVYSLVSACGACQGSQWTQYVFRSKLRKVFTNDVLSDGLSGSTIVLLWLQLPRRCFSLQMPRSHSITAFLKPR